MLQYTFNPYWKIVKTGINKSNPSRENMTEEITSIETVLNSRCSSGFEVGINKRHWGILTSKIPEATKINKILSLLQIPRFSEGKLQNWFEGERLFLGFQADNDTVVNRILNIESGMQQQALNLYCTAFKLGLGTINQGIDGTPYGEKIAATSYIIRETLPSYKRGFFTTSKPGQPRSFKSSKKLSAPVRESKQDFFTNMPSLTSSSNKGSQASEHDKSQLLWAAKGRTPHLIRLQVLKMMWGLTIPTWKGGQDYTRVHLITGKKNYLYTNLTKGIIPKSIVPQQISWIQGRPTHDLEQTGEINIDNMLDGFNNAIILCNNENTNKSLWEIGYMLENLFLQAKSLQIIFKSKIFSQSEIQEIGNKGLSNPVAAVMF